MSSNDSQILLQLQVHLKSVDANRQGSQEGQALSVRRTVHRRGQGLHLHGLMTISKHKGWVYAATSMEEAVERRRFRGMSVWLC
jgi:uncharacterized pyridoxal phosphate-containing UPF0001 family protein